MKKSLVLYYYPPQFKRKKTFPFIETGLVAGHIAIAMESLVSKKTETVFVMDKGGYQNASDNEENFGKPVKVYLSPTRKMTSYTEDTSKKTKAQLTELKEREFSSLSFNCVYSASLYLHALGYDFAPTRYNTPEMLTQIVKEKYSFIHKLREILILANKKGAEDNRWQNIKKSLLQTINIEEISQKGFLQWQANVDWGTIIDNIEKLRDACEDHRNFKLMREYGSCFFKPAMPASWSKLNELLQLAEMHNGFNKASEKRHKKPAAETRNSTSGSFSYSR